MSVTEKIIKKRGAKVNSKQKKILLQFMADNPAIFYYKITPEFTVKHHNAFWHNMSTVLNIYGPPRKTDESWKKAWKDIKLRYRKAGIDLKGIMNTLKSEPVVDTQKLMGKVENLENLEEIIHIENILQENDPDKSSIELNLPGIRPRLINDIDNINIDLDSALSSPNEFELTQSEEETSVKSKPKMKIEKNKRECDDMYVAVEEFVETEMDFDNEIDDISSDSKEKLSTGKKDSMSSDYSDSDQEDLSEKFTRYVEDRKKRLSAQCPDQNKRFQNSLIKSNYIPENKNEDNQKNGTKKTIITELITEIRKFNTMQSEKLNLKKEYFEHQKLMAEHTLAAQKEMAKAHILLANSIRTFVDNISFNK